MALQVRRGTNAERQTITPQEGELLYTTDTKNIFVGDGSTAGGNPVLGINSIIDDSSPQLGGPLDLNGQNITGTGNIDIDGTITATGNINLGDNSADNIIASGSFASSLTPATDSAYNIGTSSLRWNNGWFTGLQVDGQLNAVSVNADIVADDSTIAYNKQTNTFTGDITGNITGGVIASDSTTIIDHVAKTVTGTLTGDVTGNLTGNVTGDVVGDIVGSVFNDDSTMIIDGGTRDGFFRNIDIEDGTCVLLTATEKFVGELEGDVTGDIKSANGVVVLNNGLVGTDALYTGAINATGTLTGDVVGSVFGDDSVVIIDGITGELFAEKINYPANIEIEGTDPATDTQLIFSSNDGSPVANFRRKSASDISGSDLAYGTINFERDDTGGRVTTSRISATRDFFIIGNNGSGTLTGDDYLTITNGDFGVGTFSPRTKLDVNGPIIPGTYADATARDTAIPSPVAGMMIYLTSTNKHQGYNGTTWNDLY